MRKVWQIGLILIGLSLSIAFAFRFSLPSAQMPISASSPVSQVIQYKSRPLAGNSKRSLTPSVVLHVGVPVAFRQKTTLSLWFGLNRSLDTITDGNKQ
ncbi:hypothetical protein [Phormidesmis priestleyi]